MIQVMTIGGASSRPPQPYRGGYDMQAMAMDAGYAFQASHYAAVRSRLMGARPKPQRPLVRRWSYAPAPLPVLPHPVEVDDQPGIRRGWRSIVTHVAQRHGISSADILGRSRCREISRARQEAIYHVVTETSLTLPMIGRCFGRDHTTILHSYRVHKDRLASGVTPKRDMILTGAPRGATLKERCHEVVKLVALKHGVSPAQIYGNQRHVGLHEARKEVFLTLYLDHGLNFSEIGQGVGDRDHATIIYAIGHLVAPRAETVDP